MTTFTHKYSTTCNFCDHGTITFTYDCTIYRQSYIPPHLSVTTSHTSPPERIATSIFRIEKRFPGIWTQRVPSKLHGVTSQKTVIWNRHMLIACWLPVLRLWRLRKYVPPKTSVNLQQTTLRHMPDNSFLIILSHVLVTIDGVRV